jgi:hypothetical protein
LVGIETAEAENFTTLVTSFEEHWVSYEDITNDEVLFDLLV